MFINLTQTDIPFEKYYLSQDQIDAIKFRLLQSEIYLNADDLSEHIYGGYYVFLINKDGTPKALIAGIETEDEYDYPLLRLIDLSNEKPKRLSHKELVNFICDLYDRNPDKPLISNFVFSEQTLQNLLWIRKVEIEYLIKNTWPEDITCHHYENNKEKHSMASYDFSLEEQAEINHLMTIILKKIYNIDYTENIAEWISFK